MRSSPDVTFRRGRLSLLVYAATRKGMAAMWAEEQGASGTNYVIVEVACCVFGRAQANLLTSSWLGGAVRAAMGSVSVFT